MRWVVLSILCLLWLFPAIDGTAAQDAPIARIAPVTVETQSGSTVFMAEIADTEELRTRGLMFRHRLPPDRAMLFDFKVTRQVMMWMRNTRIPLDMIFIKANGRVAKVAEDTVPMSETIIDSEVPVAFVLEVAAGTARRIGLKPGDRVVYRAASNPSG
jgi:hypothetical protein